MSISTFMSGVWSGKSLGRILQNDRLAPLLSNLHGHVLDLAGDRRASYTKSLPKDIHLTIANDTDSSRPDTRVDFNEMFPFAPQSFDAIVFLNALYISKNPVQTLRECRRVLKPHGTLILSTPFIAHEMPEPHDFVRWTKEGLEQLLSEAGFVKHRIERIGARSSASANLLHPILRWNIIRMVVYAKALLLDRLLRTKEMKHPCPILYLAVSSAGDAA